MEPLITPEQMRQADSAADEPLDVIIDRVGSHLAMHAIDMLGGTYGCRVVVLAGPGNNGADGRAAAHHLRRRGIAVAEIAVADAPDRLPSCDLVIDAAFGTGLSKPYLPPVLPDGTLVLAVDISSGFDGLTGAQHGEPWAAHRTVVIAGLKPGLFFEPARSSTGELQVIDIGLDPDHTITPAAYAIARGDVASWLVPRQPSHHKWKSACWIIAGSAGMTGAALLAAAGAQRAGASYVRLSVPEGKAESPIAEVVSTPIGLSLETPDIDRFAALVIGPGLGRDPQITSSLIELITRTSLPLVLDADALWHLRGVAEAVLKHRHGPVILTPHDREFSYLAGDVPQTDRIASAQDLANRLNAVVLLKGATTVIASPTSAAHVVSEGDVRLATAGTGDVLAGIVGALLTQGIEPQRAASASAFLHARAAKLGPVDGLVASDLPALLPKAISVVRGTSLLE